MKRLTFKQPIRAALGAVFMALALPAFGQLAPGNYTANGVPFTVLANGTILNNLGTFIVLPEAGCSGTHLHGFFFGVPDSPGCGHGIAVPAGVATILPGGTALLPGQVPNSAAGQLTLTRPNLGYDADTAGELFLAGFSVLTGYYGNLKNDEYFLSRARYAIWPEMVEEEIKSRAMMLGGAFRGIRDDAAKLPPPTPLPGGGIDAPEESILDSFPEMQGIEGDTLKPSASQPATNQAPDPEQQKMQQAVDKAAQDIADALFSGNADKGKAAASALGNAPKDLQNRVVRKIIERQQKIVNDTMRAATNAAAGAPRVLN